MWVAMWDKTRARKKPLQSQGLNSIFGGSGEIRTHGGLTPSSVFKTGAFNRSATLPCAPSYGAFIHLTSEKYSQSIQVHILSPNTIKNHNIAAISAPSRIARFASSSPASFAPPIIW